MKINVIAFARLREIIGARQFQLEVEPEATVADLRKLLSEKHPLIGADFSYAIALNEVYVEDDVIIPPDADIALIPPVSGG